MYCFVFYEESERECEGVMASLQDKIQRIRKKTGVW